MASWRYKRNAELKRLYSGDTYTQWRTKRDAAFAASGVGGNAKSGIKFYGKGNPSLKVGDSFLET